VARSRENHVADVAGAAQRALVDTTVKVSWRVALLMAKQIAQPWYRTQSLAKVLAHTPPERADEVLALALAAADRCDDDWQRLTVRVWIVEGLFARGDSARGAELARGIVAALPTIAHGGSRSEVVWLLAWKLRGNDLELERTLAEFAARAGTATAHWRTRRAAHRVVCSFAARDRAAAERFAELVGDTKTRRWILRDIERWVRHSGG
jgi:hypothetical protein